MKQGKNKDLEKRRSYLFQIGLIVSTSLVLVAFEWTTFDSNALSYSGIEGESMAIELDEIQRSFPKKPLVSKPKANISHVIKISDEPMEDPNKKDLTYDPLKNIIAFDMNGEDNPCEDCEEFDDDGPIKPLGYMFVEITPHYNDCENILDRKAQLKCTEDEMIRQVSKNAKYPMRAKEGGIQGTVIVAYVIDKKGNITDVQVTRSVHRLLDEAAVKAVKTLKPMNPGMQQGKAVPVQFSIPVSFAIHN